MVGRDTPEPNAWGDYIRPIYLVGYGLRSKNPPALAVGSVKNYSDGSEDFGMFSGAKASLSLETAL